jgi:hypothetical protein
MAVIESSEQIATSHAQVSHKKPSKSVQDAKKKLYLTYFWASIVVFLLVSVFAYGPFWQRDIMNPADRDVVIKWYEYVRHFINLILPAAFYGLLALVPLQRLSKGKKVGTKYFIGAIIVGLAAAVLAFFAGEIARSECNNNCAAYVPSYMAYRIMFLISLIPLVIVPFLFWRKARKLDLITEYKL